MSYRWTRDRESRLERLYLSGQSYGQLATSLGITRSAVAGKISRLHLEPINRLRCTNRPSRVEPKPTPQVAPPAASPPTRSWEPPPKGVNHGLLPKSDLRAMLRNAVENT